MHSGRGHKIKEDGFELATSTVLTLADVESFLSIENGAKKPAHKRLRQEGPSLGLGPPQLGLNSGQILAIGPSLSPQRFRILSVVWFKV